VRAKTIAAVLALAAIVGASLPVGSSYAEGPASRGTKPTVLENLVLQGTNGFVVEVTVLDRSKFTLTATSLSGSLFSTRSAEYAMPFRQPHGSDSIKARIGSLGRIDVRFVPEASKEVPPFFSFCKGGKTVNEIGRYVGFIAFRGEHGYTRVRAHSAFGSVTRQPALTCDASKVGESERQPHEKAKQGQGEREVQEVELKAVVPSTHVSFLADRLSTKRKGHGYSLTNFIVAGVRRRGAIRESSIASALFEKGLHFKLPDRELPTRGAVIAPPAPFTGSATFKRESGQQPSWTGDLAVELPGFGNVRLATPGVSASMCEVPACRSAGLLSQPVPARDRWLP
jgi:hypothetical protein